MREEFEGDGLAESKVSGSIDFSHAAFAEKSDDAIAAIEQSARKEAAFERFEMGGMGAAVWGGSCGPNHSLCEIAC